MKQPQLGHKILELRKAKGLTQEELVEKCNLNVRTLQRIEAGEVSPRTHTLKTIFEALEYAYNEPSYFDPQAILIDLKKNSTNSWLTPDPVVTKALGFSLIAGGIYYILVFFEIGMELSLIKDFGESDSPFWVLWNDDISPVSPFWFLLIKVLVMIAFILFIRGFYLLGEKIKNNWLKSASLSYIVIFCITIFADLLFFLLPEWPIELLLISKSMLYGIGLLLFSLSLLAARQVLGPLALITGSLGIANGIFFVSIFLALPGILFLTVVELLQLILLFRCRLLFANKEVQGDSRNPMLNIADQI